MKKRVYVAIIIACYLASIVLGVWAVKAIGVVDIGFGLMAPAAVYFVGATLVLRDLVQEAAGKWTSMGLIFVAAAISYLISPALAVASGVAFVCSELLDLVVYTKVRKTGLIPAVLASNALSLVVDSLVFLTIAFGSLAFLPGQMLGKAIATLIAVLILDAVQQYRGADEVLSRDA